MKMTSKRLITIMASVTSLFALFAISSSAATSSTHDPYMMDGRWCQNYTLSSSASRWNYTTQDWLSYSGVQKLFSSRPFLIDCDANTLTAYQTAFAGAVAFSDGGNITDTTWVAGVGSNSAKYHYVPSGSETVCMGTRTDECAVGTYTNSGIWSPDTAY